jgi:signal transduction histidine kinase
MSKRDNLIDLLIHDLAGPISIISTSTNSLLIKESKYGPLTHRQRQTLERILRSTNKAQALLAEMVEVYRSEEGVFHCSSFLIREVLNESIMDALEVANPVIAGKLAFIKRDDAFYRILEENGIFVECTGKYCQIPFYHDLKKIQQVMRNLISNALKYRRERVTISATGDSDLVIYVRDDGPGIPHEEMTNIFKRFGILKGKTGEETKMQGFGFGMSCVKILVDVMGGEINLESKEGDGTCFTVRVPPHQLFTEKEALQ